ncbi:GvpL/GvpF family gas vesicle protein [Streptomyces thermolineatus]|uniref:GvpL/GvpF family gas vesicle protein n=1 Tax=Streptomyces thermolineatus TaxID=44033 RepID=A0ABN3N0H2_9ACTN
MTAAPCTTGVPTATDVPTATCVFAVCRGGDPAALEGMPGHEEGARVRLLPLGSLTAVVQDVPADRFSEEAVRERLSDGAELERCARTHHAVVSAAARCAPTVPLPLATLYLGDERARAALGKREQHLHAALDRIEGRAEWAVKAYTVPVRPDAPAPAGKPEGPAAPAASSPDGPGSGRAYLERVRSRKRARDLRQEAALRAAERVDTALRGLAVAARRLRLHGPGPDGDRRTQVLNAAYLVDGDRDRELAAAVGRLRQEAEADGVRIEVSGPWVPYSFVDGGGTGDLDC